MNDETQQFGSAIERAKEYGLDLTLNMAMLKRSPTERVQMLQEWMEFAQEIDKARNKLYFGKHLGQG
ncbi:MAG: hypothetical protein EPO24_10660 [Bacteroidetes bacterium]|nr:MAG: hypothetical protein EPO24_10660 [Bacteroidota bacterium]